jgi:hypothetical protein
VSVDGWASTHQAWLALFPLVVPLRCVLRGWLNIRSRGKLSDSLAELSRRVWESYRAPSRGSFARRLREWARRRRMSARLMEQVEKRCGRSKEYAGAYSHPGGHRTSNMLDRLMRSMDRYFDDGQHLHGGAGHATGIAGRGRCSTTSGRGTRRRRGRTTAGATRRSGSTSTATTTTGCRTC